MTARMSQHQSADTDSLIALDALLNIGSSVRAGAGFGSNDVGSSPQVVVERNLTRNPMGGGFTAGQVSAISAMLSLNASLGLPPPAGGSPSYNHLIAVRTAAAAAAIQLSHNSSYSMVTASPGFGNGVLIPSTAAGRHQSIAAQPESRNYGKLPFGDGTREGTTKATTEKNNPASNKEQQVVFRQEKVEAALNSKAQRGKKRDNLSASERLELTRTRNREHAKGTRIRKKARYQELLDCEQQLLDIAQSDDLKSQRQQSVKDFFSIRECMIQHIGSSSSGAEDDKPSISGSSRLVEAKTDGSVQLITRCDKVEYPTLPREVVESFDDFRYNASELGPILSAQSSSSETQSSWYNMRLWDEIITSRIGECFGEDACRSLVYKVAGDLDGIAISNADNGFAHVDLVLNANGGKCVLSGIMTAHFAPGSSRLLSAVWTTTADNTSKMMPRPSQHHDDLAALPETLGNQRVYPSNVSLDHDKANEAEEAHIPGGMNF